MAVALVPLKDGVLKIDYADWQDLKKFKWRVRKDKRVVRNTYRSIGEKAGGIVRIHQHLNPTWAETDHINRDPLDNRRANLRLVNPNQNHWNRIKQRNNTSGYKGVSLNKQSGKWEARICAYSKQFFLGLFNSPELAFEAYKSAAKELHGEFAKW